MNQMNKTEVQVVKWIDEAWRRETRDERVCLVERNQTNQTNQIDQTDQKHQTD